MSVNRRRFRGALEKQETRGVWVDVEQPPGRHFALDFIRRTQNTTADVIVEVSSDMETWDSGGAFTALHSIEERDPDTVRVVERMVEQSTEKPAAFMRIKIAPKSP